MNQWCHELIGSLPLHQAPQRLLERVVLVAQDLGFEFCAIGVRLPYPLSSPRVELVSNYPKQWQAHYASEQYLARDPSVAYASRNSSLRLWDDQLFSGEQEMWSGARSAGLRHVDGFGLTAIQIPTKTIGSQPAEREGHNNVVNAGQKLTRLL